MISPCVHMIFFEVGRPLHSPIMNIRNRRLFQLLCLVFFADNFCVSIQRIGNHMGTIIIMNGRSNTTKTHNKWRMNHPISCWFLQNCMCAICKAILAAVTAKDMASQINPNFRLHQIKKAYKNNKHTHLNVWIIITFICFPVSFSKLAYMIAVDWEQIVSIREPILCFFF